MFCTHCGSLNPDGAKFCINCGKNPTGISPATVSKSYSPTLVIFLIVGRIVLISLLISVTKIVYYTGATDGLKKDSATIKKKIEQDMPIVASSFVVPASSMRWFPFLIPPGNPIIVGHFEATGGSGNDIICLITDQDGLTNLRNNHTIYPFFNSGKVTTQSVNVKLSLGSYFLVFNNRFSPFSSKAVNATIRFKFED
jgi:hypothetical protein